MIDTILNLMFRCSHRSLTRPVTPATKAGQPRSGTYVVCLDCGKQFAYDTKEMRMGKALDRSHDAGVLPPETGAKRSGKLKYALWAGVPLAVVLGVAIKNGKKKGGKQEPGSAAAKPPAKPAASAQPGGPEDTERKS